MLASCENCRNCNSRTKKCMVGNRPDDGLLCAEYVISAEFRDGLVKKIKEDIFEEIGLAALSEKTRRYPSPLFCM